MYLFVLHENLNPRPWQKCPKTNSCSDPSSRSSLQFLNHFDYIDDHNYSAMFCYSLATSYKFRVVGIKKDFSIVQNPFLKTFNFEFH